MITLISIAKDQTIREQLINWMGSIIPWILAHGVRILVILVGAFLLNSIISKVIKKAVRAATTRERHETGTDEVQREETLIRIFNRTIKVTIISIATLMILSEMGLMIGPILAGAGIIGLAVSFGAQSLIKDMIAGFFIVIENQYHVGDFVNFEGTRGLVEDITLRMTTLRDIDGTVHHVPHGEIKKVANLSKNFSRVNINITIAYTSNLEQVISVVNKTGNELAEDPLWKEFIIKPPQFLRVEDLNDAGIVIKILGDTQPIKQWEVSGEYRKRIKDAFEKEGIEIPLRQIVMNQPK